MFSQIYPGFSWELSSDISSESASVVVLSRWLIALRVFLATSPEYSKLVRAAQCSRDILDYVNQAVKDCENHHKLVSLQKRLDTKPIQSSTNPLVMNYKVHMS